MPSTAKIQLNESSAAVLAISFVDETDTPTTPTTLEYRIDCESNDQEILDWTEVVGLSTTVEVPITASQNAIITDANLTEVKVVTIRVDYGLDTQYVDDFRYTVQNLKFFPGI